MERWSYIVIDLPGQGDEHQARLNKLGAEGWELVGILSLPMCFRAYLKRKSFEAYPHKDHNLENAANQP